MQYNIFWKLKVTQLILKIGPKWIGNMFTRINIFTASFIISIIGLIWSSIQLVTSSIFVIFNQDIAKLFEFFQDLQIRNDVSWQQLELLKSLVSQSKLFEVLIFLSVCNFVANLALMHGVTGHLILLWHKIAKWTSYSDLKIWRGSY